MQVGRRLQLGAQVHHQLPGYRLRWSVRLHVPSFILYTLVHHGHRLRGPRRRVHKVVAVQGKQRRLRSIIVTGDHVIGRDVIRRNGDDELVVERQWLRDPEYACVWNRRQRHRISMSSRSGVLLYARPWGLDDMRRRERLPCTGAAERHERSMPGGRRPTLQNNGGVRGRQLPMQRARQRLLQIGRVCLRPNYRWATAVCSMRSVERSALSCATAGLGLGLLNWKPATRRTSRP